MNEAKVVKTEKKKIPFKLFIGLFFGNLGWFLPYAGLNLTLLPAQISAIDPVHKVSLVALFASVSMVIAAVANLVCGALSDRTRTRFGRRTPWIVGGTIGTVILFTGISLAHSITALLVYWSLYQIALNAVVAAVAALLADMVNPDIRGTASTFMGLGTTVGNYGSGLIAAHFIIHVQVGIWFFAGAMVLLECCAIFLIHEPSSKNLETLVDSKEKTSWKKMFSLPTKGAHDFYCALVGRFLLVAGTHMILGYQLYIFTDYMKLGSAATSSNVARVSSIMLIAGVIFAIMAGPFSDKIGRRKIPVVVTTWIVALAAFIPFIQAKPWTMLAFATLAGIAMGAYNAVDQALLVSILPSKEEAAKDLGILNLANTLGNISGPALAGLVISMIGYRFMFPAEAIMLLFSGFIISRIRSVK
jgi:MFS family permease